MIYEVTLKGDWLQDVLDSAAREVADWPPQMLVMLDEIIRDAVFTP